MPDPMQQPDDGGPLFRPAPAVGGTSAAAGEVAARSIGSWRRRILARLEERQSCLWEVAEHYGVPDHCISGRFTDLCRDGYIEPTGERRVKPATDCAAEVYRVRRAQEQAAVANMIERDYPLALRVDGDLFDRQELLPREGYPGTPYARRADTGGLRKLVRIELIDCPGCGKPLLQTDPARPRRFACGNATCRRVWHARTVLPVGGTARLALVMEDIR